MLGLRVMWTAYCGQLSINIFLLILACFRSLCRENLGGVSPFCYVLIIEAYKREGDTVTQLTIQTGNQLWWMNFLINVSLY